MEAAADATTAVRTAMDGVIAERADVQKLQASRERSEGLGKIITEQFCGIPLTPGSTSCNVGIAFYI
jgi:hypothetical protein